MKNWIKGASASLAKLDAQAQFFGMTRLGRQPLLLTTALVGVLTLTTAVPAFAQSVGGNGGISGQTSGGTTGGTGGIWQARPAEMALSAVAEAAAVLRARAAQAGVRAAGALAV